MSSAPIVPNIGFSLKIIRKCLLVLLSTRRTHRWQSKVRIYFIPLDGIPSHEPFFFYPEPDSQGNKPNEPINVFTKYAQPDAGVWSHYLDATKGEDMNRVQLWKTGIGSVLVSIRADLNTPFL